MKFKHYKIPLFGILLISVFMISCREEWDSHYYASAQSKSTKNIYQYLQSRAELSKFVQMLNIVGYDTVLTKSQTFTVWAPVNTALENVSLTDTLAIRKLVTNYITRFSCSTLGLNNAPKTVLALNGKLIPFVKTGSGFTFAGKQITEPDLATANGIIHIMGDYTPYKRSIWEFISETPGLDSLRTYINSLNKKVLDNNKSFQDGVFVDSVFKSTNYLFDNLAALNVEDSIYTAILPDNAAWVEAYNRILPYYVTSAKDGGVAKQIAATKQVLVQDLFFRGKQTYPYSADSIMSTYRNYFVNPNRLFDGAQGTEMSNGYSYVTSQLKSKATESWLKPIRIEAEYSTYGRITSNYTASPVSGLGTGFDISNKYYALLTDASSSSLSTLFVSFPLPYTLAAKYNIYCVFVPTKAVDPSDLRPYKVKFYLNYINSAGTLVTNATVDQNNTVQLPSKTPYTFTTDPTKVQKMLVVKDFQLTYRHVVPATYADFAKSITLSLKVQNATAKTITEQLSFNRNLRIDCIILEPVQ